MPVNLLFRQTGCHRRCSVARPISRWKKLQNVLRQRLGAEGKAPAMAMGLKRRIELHVSM